MTCAPVLLYAVAAGWVRALAMATKQPRGGSGPASHSLYSIGCNRILGWTVDGSSRAAAPEANTPRRWCCETALYEDEVGVFHQPW